MTVFFSDSAKREFMKQLGVSEQEVREALGQPVQRQSIALAGGHDVTMIAGVAKRGARDIVILVEGELSEGAFTVNTVLPVPRALEDAAKLDVPLTSVQQIAERFGYEISIGQVKAKFIASKKIPVASTNLRQIVQIHAPSRPRSKVIWSLMIRIVTNDGPPYADCAIAFALDTGSYRRALQTH